MKVIETRPPHRERCENCNSVYDLTHEDAYCREAKKSDDFSIATTHVIMWNCPVCTQFNRVPHERLPIEWLYKCKAPIIP